MVASASLAGSVIVPTNISGLKSRIAADIERRNQQDSLAGKSGNFTVAPAVNTNVLLDQYKKILSEINIVKDFTDSIGTASISAGGMNNLATVIAALESRNLKASATDCRTGCAGGCSTGCYSGCAATSKA